MPEIDHLEVGKKRTLFQAIDSINKHKNFIFVELYYFLLLAFILLIIPPYKMNGIYISIFAFLIFIGLLLFSIGKLEFSSALIKINCKTFILLGLMFWLVLDPLFLRGKIADFEGYLISKVFLMILIFIIFFYIGYLIKLPQILKKIFLKLEGNYSINRKKLFFIVLFFLILALLPIFIWGGGIRQGILELINPGRFVPGWTRSRLGTSFVDSFKTLFYFFQYIGLFLVFYFFFTGKNNFSNNKINYPYEKENFLHNLQFKLKYWLKRILSLFHFDDNKNKSLVNRFSNLKKILLIFLSLIVLWLVFHGGSRLDLGIIFLSFIVIIFLDYINKNRNPIYMIIIFLIILICAMQFQLIYRNISPEQANITYNHLKTGGTDLIIHFHNLGIRYIHHFKQDILHINTINSTHIKQDIGFFKEDMGHLYEYLIPLDRSCSRFLNLSYNRFVSSLAYSRDDEFFQLLRFTEKVPDKISHTNQWLIFKPLYHFIPRVIWPNKPEGTVEFFQKQIDPKEASEMTVAVSIIGEFYLVQDLFGIIIIALFLGVIARQLDSLKSMIKNSPAILLMYSFGLVIMFATIRGYLVFTEMIYVYVGLFLLLLFIKNIDTIIKSH